MAKITAAQLKVIKKGKPDQCPVEPCPEDCPGLKLCKQAHAPEETIDLAAVTEAARKNSLGSLQFDDSVHD